MRVVENADLLSAEQERRLVAQLRSHEEASSNQLVVVTLPSLQGTAIDDFGYQLGRHWGIGQQGRDNGVLLIVARSEEHTSELQSLMRRSYAVFCLKKKQNK